jgi:hypothetical protein
MKILHSQFLQKYLPPATLATSLLAAYLGTLAPGLTWANGGSDGGDLIAAVATGGIAHPTGYPLYLLLARVFQFLPLGSLAFRTNLMSALAAVLAALLVYEIVSHSQRASDSKPAWLGGMAAGYAFGLAPLVWSQAVITEVYALQAFLTALILYLYTRAARPGNGGQKQRDSWRGLVLGLAMGNHVTTLLLVPAALVLGSVQGQPDVSTNGKRSRFENLKFDRGAFLRQAAAFVAGLSIYLVIPLRALGHPSVNWGNAVTPARFWWLVSGQLYQSYYLQFDLSGFWERAQAWAALLIDQFGLPGLILGLIGLVVFGARSRLYALTGWIAAISLIFTVFYRSNDSHVYLIPMLMSFAIWVGLGIEGLVRPLSLRRPILGIGLGLILIAYLVGRSTVHWRAVDASQDVRAEAFGREVLSHAPQSAILFADGDQAIFALWYFHFALRERPDLSVVAGDLLHFNWYQENLRATYPSLIIPGPFPWPETIAIANPSRAVCYAQYSDRPEIDCSEPGTSP